MTAEHNKNRFEPEVKKPTLNEWLAWANAHEQDTEWVYNLTPEQRVWLAQQAEDTNDS